MFHKGYRKRKNNHTSGISELLKNKTTERQNINNSKNTQIIILEKRNYRTASAILEELKLLKKTQIHYKANYERTNM